ncbi:MAG: hypothetical protein Aurels2KO_06800 [Aureliella sp.]
MNSRTFISATILFFVASATFAGSHYATDGEKAKTPPLRALAGPNFYDFFAVISRDSAGAAAWYAGISAAVGHVDGAIEELLENRLLLLEATGGPMVESWERAAANRALEREADRSSKVAIVDRQSLPPVSATVRHEIELLKLAAKALTQPSAENWDEQLIATIRQRTDWQPGFSAFAHLLASDHAIASGRFVRALEYGVWARIHADSSDRAVLRRAARERILHALSKLGRLESELGQNAALQLAGRERVSESIRDMAHSVLQIQAADDLSSVKSLARRIAFDGSEQIDASGKQVRTRAYLLATLHAVTSPGPTTGMRKRLSLLEEAIQLAESHNGGLAARLKVAYLHALLRIQRFSAVNDLAEETIPATESLQFQSLCIEISAIASIAAARSQKIDLHKGWTESARQSLQRLVSQPATDDFEFAPRSVLQELLVSRVAKKADRSDARSLTNLSKASLQSEKAAKTASRLAEREQRQTSRWSLIAITCAAVVGLLGVLAVAVLRRSRREPIADYAVPQTPLPVALLGPPADSSLSIDKSLGEAAEFDGVAVLARKEDAQESKSKRVGTTSFQLGQLLRVAIADLQRRSFAAKFELASDSAGDHDQTIVADYSKLLRFIRHLGIATSDVVEGGRVMVGGMLRDGIADGEITLELSFTYPLRMTAGRVSTASLGDSWAEDNVLASLVHLLSSSVSHQREDNLGCLLASVPLLAVHSSDHTAGERVAAKDQSVLVVDSDPLVLKSLSASLQALGCNYACGSSLDETRGLLTQPQNYSIVLLDIGLPDNGSLVLAEEVRQLPRSVRPTLVAMRNAANTGLGSRVASDGFDEVLVKPCTLQRLSSVVHAARVD